MTTPSHDHPDHTHPCPAAEEGTDSPAAWDRRYADLDQVWSGRPNGALVTEVAGLPAGRALDVGCGEGADAVWLSSQGWQVTALDVSQVALERAAQAAEKAGAEVRWVHAGLLEAEDWQLEVHQERPRSITGGAGAHHVDDVVVRARRLR